MSTTAPALRDSPGKAFRSVAVTVLILLLTGFAAAATSRRTWRVDDPSRSPDARPENRVIDFRVNLNAAAARELAVLPGLGPKLAGRIVEYRQVHGPFGSESELNRVSGIGPSIVERIGPFLILGEPSPEPDSDARSSAAVDNDS